LPDDELTVQLLQHLRAALEISMQLDDASATYFVRRALDACRRRWDAGHELPPFETME